MEEVIKRGDDVLLYLDERRKYLVKAEDKVFHTHKGFVELSSIIGKPYGSVVQSSLSVPFVALKPTIYDYMYRLSRKTQVLYFKDVALIVLRLGLGPGARVVEGGTGSGALTSV